METHTFTAVDAISAIWRRKYTVAIFAAVSVVLVGMITVLVPKTYISDAKIFVRLGRENAAPDVTAGLGETQIYSMPPNRESEINSISEMITNKELFGRVVDKIGPERILKKVPNSPAKTRGGGEATSPIDNVMVFLTQIGVLNGLNNRERAIIKLQKKTGVDVGETSNVITVRFESYDADLAREVVDAIVDDYTKQHSRIHRAQGGSEFMSAQTQIVRQALYESERKFEEFKNKTKLISVEDQRRVLVDRIARIKNELMDAEAMTQAAKSEVNTLQQLTERLPTSRIVSQTEGSGNEGIDGMRQELFRLQVKREELVSKFSEANPQVKQVERQLAAAKKLFDEAEAKLVESVEGPSRVHEGANLELIKKQPALEALRSKSSELQLQLMAVTEKLDEFNAHETEFIRLQREMQICDENFKRYTRTLQQASMDYAMQEENLSNLSVFQAASLNPKPHRPRKLVNLAAGLFLGLLGGCSLAVLLEYRKSMLNRASELETTLDVPVVATIPQQPLRTLVKTN